MNSLTQCAIFRKIRFYEGRKPHRESYWYNNLMYGLVAYATELIGGDTWEHILQDRIFTPLGMDKTTFTHVTDMSRTDVATPYLYDNGQWRAVSSKLHRYVYINIFNIAPAFVNYDIEKC